MTKLLTAFFAWVVVYVVVTATLFGFQRASLAMALPVQTFVLTIALVPAMIFVIGPLAGTLAQKIVRKFG